MHRAHEAKIFEYELHEALEHLARHIAGYLAGHIKERKHQGQKVVRACE